MAGKDTYAGDVVATQMHAPPVHGQRPPAKAGATASLVPSPACRSMTGAATALSALGVLATIIGLAVNNKPVDEAGVLRNLLSMLVLPLAIVIGLLGLPTVLTSARALTSSRAIAPAVLFAGATAWATQAAGQLGSLMASGSGVMRSIASIGQNSIKPEEMDVFKDVMRLFNLGTSRGHAGYVTAGVGGFVTYAAMLFLIVAWGGWWRPLATWAGGRGRGVSGWTASRVVGAAGLGLVAIGMALSLAAGLIPFVSGGAAASAVTSTLMQFLPALALGAASLGAGGRGRLAALGALVIVLSTCMLPATWKTGTDKLTYASHLVAGVGAVFAMFGLGSADKRGTASPAQTSSAGAWGVALACVGSLLTFISIILVRPSMWGYIVPWAGVLAAVIAAGVHIGGGAASARHRLPMAAVLIGAGAVALTYSAATITSLRIVGGIFDGMDGLSLVLRGMAPFIVHAAGWMASFAGCAIAAYAIAAAPCDAVDGGEAEAADPTKGVAAAV